MDRKFAERLKQFFGDDEIQEAINKNDFSLIYDKIADWFHESEVSFITSTFLSSGINPLLYVNAVPENYMFMRDDLETLALPDNILRIRGRAFFASSIMHVKLPDKLHYIGDMAFFGCDRLSRIDFGSDLQWIGNQTFQQTAITELELPSKVAHIGSNAFRGCSKLNKIALPASLESIEERAFWWCGKDLEVTYMGSMGMLADINKGNNIFDDRTIIHCTDGKMQVVDNFYYLIS